MFVLVGWLRQQRLTGINVEYPQGMSTFISRKINPLFCKGYRAKNGSILTQESPGDRAPRLILYGSMVSANSEVVGLYFIRHCIRFTAR